MFRYSRGDGFSIVLGGLRTVSASYVHIGGSCAVTAMTIISLGAVVVSQRHGASSELGVGMLLGFSEVVLLDNP